MESNPLTLFEVYAVTKGYQASFDHDTLFIYNVTNVDNNFSIQKADGYYTVNTIKVSKADYEYTAKCTIYLLMAEFNKDQSERHLHINFKVEL